MFNGRKFENSIAGTGNRGASVPWKSGTSDLVGRPRPVGEIVGETVGENQNCIFAYKKL